MDGEGFGVVEQAEAAQVDEHRVRVDARDQCGADVRLECVEGRCCENELLDWAGYLGGHEVEDGLAVASEQHAGRPPAGGAHQLLVLHDLRRPPEVGGSEAVDLAVQLDLHAGREHVPGTEEHQPHAVREGVDQVGDVIGLEVIGAGHDEHGVVVVLSPEGGFLGELREGLRLVAGGVGPAPGPAGVALQPAADQPALARAARGDDGDHARGGVGVEALQRLRSDVPGAGRPRLGPACSRHARVPP